MKLIKQILNFAVTVSLSVVILYLAQEFVKEVKTYEEIDYADAKGCAADDFDFNWCA